MKLIKIKIVFFISLMLISEKVFAGGHFFWLPSGGIQGNLPNLIGYSFAAIMMLSAVTTIVIWKSYLSEWIIKRSALKDAVWDIEKLKSHTRETIHKLNDAIENNDLSRVTDLLTPELLDEQNSFISKNIKKGEKNILRCNDIRVLEVIGCEDYNDNSYDKYVAYIQGYMLDYIILEATGAILRNKKRQVWRFSRTYHFVRVENQWKLGKINTSASTIDVLKIKNLYQK
jgi:hypothetical protein